MVKPEGRFIYRYPLSEPREAEVLYSPIRHIAGVWFMLEADRALGPLDAVRTAALRAGDQIAAEFLTPFAGQDMLCVLDEGLIKLGGAGLAVTTLCAMHDVTGEGRYLHLAERLSRFVLSQRQDSGDFILRGKVDNVSGQLIFIGSCRGNISLCPPGLPDDPAGCAFAQCILLTSCIHRLPEASHCRPSSSAVRNA